MPLFLLPGTMCDARLFAPMLRAMPERQAQVLEYSAADTIAQAAASLVDALPPRVILLGHSLGGIVALHMAIAFPQRVAGLVLIGSNARAVAPAQRAVRRAAAAGVDAAGLAAYVRAELWPLYTGDRGGSQRGMADEVVAMAVSAGIEAFHWQGEAALTRPDLRAHLSRITMPVLVLGGAQDRLGTPGMQREMVALLPDAELNLLPDVGHLAPLEAPRETAAIVARWLQKNDRAIISSPRPTTLTPESVA